MSDERIDKEVEQWFSLQAMRGKDTDTFPVMQESTTVHLTYTCTDWSTFVGLSSFLFGLVAIIKSKACNDYEIYTICHRSYGVYGTPDKEIDEKCIEE